MHFPMLKCHDLPKAAAASIYDYSVTSTVLMHYECETMTFEE